MAEQDSWQSLTRFYDGHPVNEDSILQQLESQGVSLGTLSEEVLKDHDMDHFGGTDALDILAGKTGIQASSYVLDVCSGIGGPARYLAQRYGCRVIGLDITASRHQSALRLTKLVKLDHLVGFHLGDALEMPFSDDTFDVVIGQEAWAHIPDKSRLFGECARVLKSGGMIAFTDFLRRGTLDPSELERWEQHWGGAATPETLESYSRFLREAGLAKVLRGGQRSFEHMTDFMYALLPDDSPVRTALVDVWGDRSKRSLQGMLAGPYKHADRGKIPGLAAKAAAADVWVCPTLVMNRKQAANGMEFEAFRRQPTMQNHPALALGARNKPRDRDTSPPTTPEHSPKSCKGFASNEHTGSLEDPRGYGTVSLLAACGSLHRKRKSS